MSLPARNITLDWITDIEEVQSGVTRKLLHYELLNFTEFGYGPYFAVFRRIRARCRRKTIVRLTSVSKSTFDSL